MEEVPAERVRSAVLVFDSHSVPPADEAPPL